MYAVKVSMGMILLLVLLLLFFSRCCVDFLIRFFRNRNYHKHYARVRCGDSHRTSDSLANLSYWFKCRIYEILGILGISCFSWLLCIRSVNCCGFRSLICAAVRHLNQKLTFLKQSGVCVLHMLLLHDVLLFACYWLQRNLMFSSILQGNLKNIAGCSTIPQYVSISHVVE